MALGFSQTQQQFEEIKKAATSALQAVFPVEGKTRKLILQEAWVDDTQDPTDYKAQASAKVGEKTWGVPVYAHLKLLDTAGHTLDESRKVKLFTLPKPTQRHSYIVGGNEYQVSNQLRLKPGVYTIRKQNEELKTQVNLAKGKNFDLTFDENKGLFSINKIGGGQANIQLYPILIHLGISKSAMEHTWSNKIAAANEAYNDPKAVDRLEAAFGVKRNENLKSYLNNTELDPKVTKLTLGKEFNKVDGELLLAASKKLLNVHMSKEEPVDRDSLEYKELHGLDDFIKERLEKNKQTLIYKIKRNIDSPKKARINQIVSGGTFTSVIESFFAQDDKSSTPEQTNPLEMLTGTSRVTIMGAGGIGTTHAITPEMRQIHSSHFGLIDPIHSPEGERVGVNLHLPIGAVKVGKNLKMTVVDKNGKEHLLDSTEARSKYIVLPDQKGKTVKAMHEGEVTDIPLSKADYFIPDPSHLFSWSSNMVPFLPSAQGNRAMMAAKMLEQAISLKHREAPLVQSMHPSGASMEKVVGEYASVTSPVDGVVKAISEDEMTIGDTKVNLYNNFTLNRKSFIHNTPIVKVGDKVKKGQLIADSNYTKGGVLALGTNLRTAYIPYKGLNYDDGIVISETAAQKLTSEHIYTKDVPLYENTILNLSAFKSYYPSAGTAANLSKLDKDGVIRKGEKVKYGEIYVAALQTRNISKEIGLVSKVLSERPKDVSLIWSLEDEGTVIDVIQQTSKVTVVIKTEEQAKIGDKLCYSSDTELLTINGWVRISNLNPTEAVATLNPENNELEYQTPSAYHVYPHTGDMVYLTGKQLDHLTTKDHELWAKPRHSDKYMRIRAKELLGGGRYHLQNYFVWTGTDVESFSFPKVPYLNWREPAVEKVDMKDWLLFLGYYLADGSTGNQSVQIRKYKSERPDQFQEVFEVLQRMGFSPRSEDNDTRIITSDKTLASYLASLGVSFEKFIPREILGLSRKYLSLLFESLVKCDGSTESGRIRYFTTSKRLADDVQELGSKLGYACSITSREQTVTEICGVNLKSTKLLYIVSCNKKIGLTPSIKSHVQSDIEAKVTLLPYEGKVYCVTVQNGVLYTRRNGKTLFSCNSNRHGGKGVITRIVPDRELPHNKAGETPEVLLNPLGVISRINVSQTYESAAGKVAAKLGEPIVVKNFDGTNQLHEVKALLSKTKTDDEEELFDPETKKSLGKVHVGMPHILKLFKQSQVNYSARQGGPGHGYDANYQPIKGGGEEGSKNVDPLTLYSLLSHGARDNLREISAIKGSKNDEFWKALKAGEQLPPPQPPFVFNKFLGYLKGAGIDVKKKGSTMTLAPFTDAMVKENSRGEVTEPLFYRGKDMEPFKNGFFDKTKFGGFKGEKWGHYELVEPVVNPPFENAAKKLTGLGGKFDGIMSGKIHIDTRTGELNHEGKGITGGAAIEHLLKQIDVDKEIEVLTTKAKKSKGNALDELNKRLRYLTALKTLNMRPEDAYIRRTLPVVPPNIRPVYPLPNGTPMSSDINFLYQNTAVLNKMMQLPVMKLLDEKDKTNIRKDLYDSVKGVSGLLDVNVMGKEREGFISEIKGGAEGQPKEGFFISRLLSKRQDYVGRGTIIPEPSLGIDEVAIPEPMAWKLFEPFVIRELKNHGKSPNQALDEIKQKSSLAKKALELVMEKRHVLLNRAPSLHKYSIMAFKPKITEGKSIKIPPLVNKAFGADHDGDTMSVHVPVGEDANNEATKMLPSKNLFQIGQGRLMVVPDQEAQVGIFYLSQTEAGRKKLSAITGPKFPVTKVLDKKSSQEFLTNIAHETPQDFAKIVQGIKAAGEKFTYDTGFSLGVHDLPDLSRERNAIITVAKKGAKGAENLYAFSKILDGRIDAILDKKLKGKGNPLYDMIDSGAKGSRTQLRSIMVSPLFVNDGKGGIVRKPIERSYSEGLDVGDYWTAMYGARAGMMGRSVQTEKPGAFSKDVMNTTIDNVISVIDCGTQDGIILPLSSNDALERYTAGPQNGVPHNTLVDTALISSLKQKKAEAVKVRSPLKCKAPKGTCAHCYGLDENGNLSSIGDNIGTKSGQAISEPLVQIAMQSFHTGGTAGSGARTQGMERIQQLLALPKIIQGAAALAPVEGKVTKITKGIAGGYDLFIGDRKVHIAQGRKPIVDVGHVVEKGDTLSDGPIRPQELAELKSMEHAQDYITNELKNEYQSQGVGIHRKNFEAVVRSLTNTTQVLNKPRDSEHLPGDVIPLTIANAYNANLVMEVPTDEAEDYPLADNVGTLRAGHVLTRADVKALLGTGHKTVKVRKDAIEHKPFVKGVTTLPLLKKDWMAALAYRNLSKALTEGAAQGWQTDIEGYHPIPAFAHGATFGKGKEGKY